MKNMEKESFNLAMEINMLVILKDQYLEKVYLLIQMVIVMMAIFNKAKNMGMEYINIKMLHMKEISPRINLMAMQKYIIIQERYIKDK